ncbi:FabG-like 3-oxoacyl-(acyl-carrier-protein) reductase [Baekduia alba]|uniref:SDR family NAD(P)-dependent oxidoreductase n=1 Tax=Baekduia alba TaxID=2997333 RepID=UPI0023420A5D|nr:SDR family NAD(P)-dependent oxidoreductase [Baekduia alba]WCB94159.1 FabG-like 3-oxoacyl-(acyl-carrier-protein) reductase [Baekduia alba]
MTTTLITGANKGLGREAARRLLDAGHDVWVGARDAAAGREAADALGARFVELDVTDDASVVAAVGTIRAAGTGLDVLINNAGIIGPRVPVPQVRPDDLAQTYATNVLGLVRVTQAFVPLLEASDAPVVVNVSSGMGSMTITSDPNRVEFGVVSLGYPSSKAAVNMLTTQYAKAYPAFRINAADPGYTATDLNGHQGHQTVTEGTDAIVALAQLGPGGPTGTFTDRSGAVPW